MLAKMDGGGRRRGAVDVGRFRANETSGGAGFADAQFALGTMYFEGRGTARDPAAAGCFRRDAAADTRRAKFGGPRRDYAAVERQDPETRTEGLAMINRAVENGHKEADDMLATAYARGDQGVLKDEKARRTPQAARRQRRCGKPICSGLALPIRRHVRRAARRGAGVVAACGGSGASEGVGDFAGRSRREVGTTDLRLESLGSQSPRVRNKQADGRGPAALP